MIQQEDATPSILMELKNMLAVQMKLYPDEFAGIEADHKEISCLTHRYQVRNCPVGASHGEIIGKIREKTGWQCIALKELNFKSVGATNDFFTLLVAAKSAPKQDAIAVEGGRALLIVRIVRNRKWHLPGL